MNEVMTKNIKIFLMSLISQNVKNFVISPGSRSTPVVILLAEIAKNNSDIKLYIDVDERSASFLGIGLSKKLHLPVALICTSGTAATEYSSAVAEAKLSKIPLIVVTTDRPMELSDIGAPQAINQQNLYGENTKSFVNLNLQDEGLEVSKYVEFETQRIAMSAVHEPVGPIQINLPLRKPLMPNLDTDDPSINKIQSLVKRADVGVDWLKKFNNKKVLIIAGPESNNYHNQLIKLATEKRIPLISDILSNTRDDSEYVVNNFDLISKKMNPKNLSEYQPDVILKFGGTLVSAPISNWLSSLNSQTTVVNINNTELNDYTLSTNAIIDGSEVDVIDAINKLDFKTDVYYSQEILKLDQKAESIKNKLIEQNFSEMSVAQVMDESVEPDSNIFLSNSMPVRDFENYYFGTQNRNIYCNRGANGIDGVTSSAMGVAIDFLHNYLVIGDLAFFHDMNGLMMAKRYNIPITIVVVNNNGGGIFSFLPQAKADEYFETLFGTPQNIKIKNVANLYDFEYLRVESENEFKKALSDSSKQKIIEVVSSRPDNVANHKLLEKQFGEGIDKYVETNR
ncbi:2-succinyl-5-enolpyruvyl-6-hydroxy-3-cyclohexene-1-carboxylic-acid synthase [Companilactobacillus ginsenosidimutans]|uniref:2-succinyl-5-enolpyruvyl-6-hydroxy-3-cyclohexene-1-carboxylate synthase n=1 Tax=Companilactobacillus ginsenosidimutans TaxID=1007676 RepID=A0A0H4QYD6_9LACO|nr:2-succinyl-5-enolpyruvyl-6-hydroxy-3-cyclohexene-1-carboxylic-acid synthase [Companilactobacillus ginsenosidimutans]AKP66480.1 hypothetical protein ABM34_02195 [Companilactobacillus ginsenosidimutans]